MNQVTAESLGKTWIENLWRIAENSPLASRASPEHPAVSVRHLGSRQKTFWPNLFEEHSLPRAQQAKLGEDWAPTPSARPGLIRALLLTTQYYSSSKQSGDQNTAVETEGMADFLTTQKNGFSNGKLLQRSSTVADIDYT